MSSIFYDNSRPRFFLLKNKTETTLKMCFILQCLSSDSSVFKCSFIYFLVFYYIFYIEINCNIGLKDDIWQRMGVT